MESINWIEQEGKGHWGKPNLVAYALIEAMSANSTDVDETFKPFDPKALNVEFKVNGVEVSFIGVMESIQKAVEDIEADCRKVMHREASKDIIYLLENKYKTWEE